MVRFQLIRMSSYAKIKLQMCWVTQRQCRSRQMWKIFTISPSTLTFYLLQKNDLSWLNNLFMVSFQLIRMLSYAKNEHQMCWVTQLQCRSRQMWKMFTNSRRALTIVCYQKWPVLTEQSIHGKFQLISMSSYAKKKQQMCRVTQHKWNVTKCGKYSQIHPVHWL